MNAERLRQIRAIFELAAAAGREDRGAVLDRECRGDPELRQAVAELLEADERPDPLLIPPDQKDGPGAPGSRIGAYRILWQIGSGGMGAVYLAARADEAFEREVAIKVVHPAARSWEVIHRFEREREIVARLDHPHIARLYDGGETEDGTPYLVMEYVDGVPITHYADEHQLTLRQRLELFTTVCGAVEYAHRNLVVHRDLKPSNILVTAQGVVKLVDFGIAKLLDAGTAGETQPSAVALTPEYASPEQIRGGPISTLSDVYSLGMALYELLAGTRPFQAAAPSPLEMARAVCEDEPPRPSAASGSKQLRGDLDNIILKALHKEPERRYSSVEQLRADVQRYLDGMPVIARRDTLGYRAWRFAGRHRGAVAASALFVAGLIAAVIVTSSAARVARGHARVAAEQRALAERRSREADQRRDEARRAQQVAEAERRKAEQRLRNNRELASAIVQFPAAIRDARLKEDAARIIARRAEQSLARLVASDETDPQLAKSLAAVRDVVRDYAPLSEPKRRLPKGWLIAGTAPNEFDAGVDQSIAHSGRASGFIRGRTSWPTGYGALEQIVTALPYRGKRVRFSAYVRSENLRGTASVFVTVYGEEGAIRNAGGHAEIPHDGVWARREIVFDAPETADRILLGVLLGSPATVWIDDAALEAVDRSVPLTNVAFRPGPVNLGLDAPEEERGGPQRGVPPGWFLTGTALREYRVSLEKNAYSGSPAAVLRSVIPAPTGFGTLMQSLDARAYRRKRVRFSAFIKSADVTNRAMLWMRADNAGQEVAAFDNMQKRPIQGATDWKRYEIVLDIPETAQTLNLGALLNGPGTISVSRFSLETVDSSVAVTADPPRPIQSPAPANLDFEDLGG